MNPPPLHPPTTVHNYDRKIAALVAAGTLKIGDFHLIGVQHEDACDFFGGGYCNCDVELRVGEFPVRPLAVELNDYTAEGRVR
jgi:hypothetical protein